MLSMLSATVYTASLVVLYQRKQYNELSAWSGCESWLALACNTMLICRDRLRHFIGSCVHGVHDMQQCCLCGMSMVIGVTGGEFIIFTAVSVSK